MERAEHEEVKKTLVSDYKNQIHHSLRVYNSDCPEYPERRSQGVRGRDLKDHMEYNFVMRFGCALFIDGICVNYGYPGKERCALVVAELAANPVKPTSCPTDIGGLYS